MLGVYIINLGSGEVGKTPQPHADEKEGVSNSDHKKKKISL